LCKNIIRAVTSDPKTPPVDRSPLLDQVSYEYISVLQQLTVR
jgi:hypothetical protein